VRRGANRIAGVVPRAVGDYSWIASIVLFDAEDDLHQVRADVGNLGEDAARDAQGRGPERLANREADEAGAGVGAGYEEKDDQHDQELYGDEEHPDAHAGLQGKGIAG